MSDTPKEQQSAYQRWEMHSFGDDRPSVVAARPPATIAASAPSEQEIAALREQARQAGFDDGHDAGYADGLATGRAEAVQELEHLRSLALAFSGALGAADEAIAADVLDLALHLAKSMLRSALAVRPELILAVVREAIDYLPVLQQPAVLKLHPDDALIVRAAIGDELEKGGWRVALDAQIARGGCKIDTATNQIDAQLGTRWERLASALGKDIGWLGP